MKPPLHLRLMTEADLPFACTLPALAGWNQTMQDWQRLLALAPTGCFIAEWNGTPAGTATTTCYGQQLAWIGMVLVHPHFRRRGIGKALLQHGLEHLRSRRIVCVKLDATPLGQPLYEQLGFQVEWPLKRWELRNSNQLRLAAADEIKSWGPNDPLERRSPSCAAADRIESWGPHDPQRLASFDTQAFGVSRQELLKRLAKDSLGALLHLSQGGQVAGYGLLREGARAAYLGPVVAASAGTGRALVEALLAWAGGRAIYWDVPDPNQAAVALAQSLGFTPQRTLARMFLGQNEHPGDPQRQFAIAEPSLG